MKASPKINKDFIFTKCSSSGNPIPTSLPTFLHMYSPWLKSQCREYHYVARMPGNTTALIQRFEYSLVHALHYLGLLDHRALRGVRLVAYEYNGHRAIGTPMHLIHLELHVIKGRAVGQILHN